MAATIRPKTGKNEEPGCPDPSPRDRGNSVWPTENADIADWTDKYFSLTKQAVEKFGDVRVTYAVFMRRPVVSAPKLAVEWLSLGSARDRGCSAWRPSGGPHSHAIVSAAAGVESPTQRASDCGGSLPSGMAAPGPS